MSELGRNLEQQVREALTDEVLQQICSHVFWKRNTSARDVIFAAINPVLTRHAQQVQALQSWEKIEGSCAVCSCEVMRRDRLVENRDDSPTWHSWCYYRAKVQALTDEVADWTLVADGVKHDWRCQNDAVTGGVKSGTWICLRCQVEALTAELDRACALLRSLMTPYGGEDPIGELLEKGEDPTGELLETERVIDEFLASVDSKAEAK